jgi:hypothetical protein
LGEQYRYWHKNTDVQRKWLYKPLDRKLQSFLPTTE